MTQGISSEMRRILPFLVAKDQGGAAVEWLEKESGPRSVTSAQRGPAGRRSASNMHIVSDDGPADAEDRDELIWARLKQARTLLAIEVDHLYERDPENPLLRHADLLIHSAMKLVREPDL